MVVSVPFGGFLLFLSRISSAKPLGVLLFLVRISSIEPKTRSPKSGCLRGAYGVLFALNVLITSCVVPFFLQVQSTVSFCCWNGAGALRAISELQPNSLCIGSHNYGFRQILQNHGSYHGPNTFQSPACPVHVLPSHQGLLFWLFIGGFTVSSGTFSWYRSSSGTDIEIPYTS